MRFDIVTLFPDFFASPLAAGLVGKALARGIAEVHLSDPRHFAIDRHHKADDEPYGGGVGMVLKAEPVVAALEALPQLPRRQVIYFTPQGEPMTQDLFKRLATDYEQLVLLCGHYEGVDERALAWVTQEISLGDFVLTCGEIPALALLNGVLRLLPGTVGKPDSLKFESFEASLLDYPHYTRPAQWRDRPVPPALQAGNHGEIADWRREAQLLRTRDRRPDLLRRYRDRLGWPQRVSLPDPAREAVLARLLAFLTQEGWNYQLTGSRAIALYGLGAADLAPDGLPETESDREPALEFDLDRASWQRLAQLLPQAAAVISGESGWNIQASESHQSSLGHIEALRWDWLIEGVAVRWVQVEGALVWRGQRRSPRTLDLSRAHPTRLDGQSLRVRPLSAIAHELKQVGQRAIAARLRTWLEGPDPSLEG